METLYLFQQSTRASARSTHIHTHTPYFTFLMSLEMKVQLIKLWADRAMSDHAMSVDEHDLVIDAGNMTLLYSTRTK